MARTRGIISRSRSRLGKLREIARDWKDSALRPVYPYEDVSIVTRAGTVVVRGYRGDYITRKLKSDGFYESELLQYLHQEFGQGGTYVDVGAFIGTHSLFFSQICRADSVLAFEPSPSTFRLLSHNLRVNSTTHVHAFNCALSDFDGSCKSVVKDSGNRGMDQIEESTLSDVQVKRGDSLDLESPKLIKIDTEGHGLAVLHGFERTIERYHPVVVVEADPTPVDCVADFLSNYDYALTAQFNKTPTFVFV